ncbi:hypothetical protein NLX83_22675 [Allokutzneria sp. A3M-2-11 16]|uniref:hypothetical protein n=1 Tax=Allokutzneria sp. A3M-2-11 16 TaxID=2962043 RepID=UPI0020B77B32|nr:hypothetical protein [Allokutzneria sp. A3M-2-11 16]MCP3802074.1 hypothetical protein [Allokutzneria sp. A3M-2-11 16]
MSDLRPKRYFTVLFPLWQVGIRAKFLDSQPYEVLDKFLERAVTECGINTVDGLATFFGLRPSVIRRLVAFLIKLGHIEMRGGEITLTTIGSRSVAMSVRYTIKHIEQELLFDSFTCSPLPKTYYSIPLPTEPLPPCEETYRQNFRPLSARFAGKPFQAKALSELAAQPDRDDFNLPKEFTDLTTTSVNTVYLPVYLVRAANEDGADTYLAFSRGANDRDVFIERLCADVPSIKHTLDVEKTNDEPDILWTKWASKNGFEPAQVLSELPNGVWRATLPNDVFTGAASKFGLPMIGSYRPFEQHFIQLWCNDARLRRRAAEERALSFLKTPQLNTRAALNEQLTYLCQQLEIDTLNADDLCVIARNRDESQAIEILDSLV